MFLSSQLNGIWFPFPSADGNKPGFVHLRCRNHTPNENIIRYVYALEGFALFLGTEVNCMFVLCIFQQCEMMGGHDSSAGNRKFSFLYVPISSKVNVSAFIV